MVGRSDGIGVLGAAAIGIGGMVGGGIFAVLGVAAQQAGGATPLAFLIAGAVAVLTAVAYTTLSVRWPSGGGTVAFVDRTFGVGEVTGSLNVLLWAGYLATTALYASAFANYLGTLLPLDGQPGPVLVRVLIAAGIGLPWLVNLADAALVARTETLVVAIKLAMLVLVIAAGVPTVRPARLDPSSWPALPAVAAAGMLIFVAYEGFELIANSSAEVRRPAWTLPRAFALCMAVVVVLYVAIALVVVGSLSPDAIAEAADFALAEAASASLGQFGFTVVGVSAVLATLSAINATLYGAARVSYTIATEGELPDRLKTRTWHQPVGLHVTAGGALVLAVTLPLASISSLSSAIFLAVFAVVNVAAVRASPSALVRTVGVVGGLGCVGSLGVLVVNAAHNDRASMVALGVLVVAVMALEFAVLRHRRPQHPTIASMGTAP